MKRTTGAVEVAVLVAVLGIGLVLLSDPPVESDAVLVVRGAPTPTLVCAREVVLAMAPVDETDAEVAVAFRQTVCGFWICAWET